MKGNYLYEEPDADWEKISLKKILNFTKNDHKYCDAILYVSFSNFELSFNTSFRFKKFIKTEDENEFFHIHRAILASRIPFFDELFDQTPEHHEFTFKVSKEALSQIILFCYEGSLLINISNVCSLIDAACLFEMKRLFNTCIKFIKANLSNQHAFLFESSLQNIKYTSYELKNLQHKIRRFIFKNFLEIRKTRSFLELDCQNLIKLLKINQLNVEREEQVII